ncbi:hypothetical protein [Actinophytocola sp.]|uniref:hypothetical protein n=1 Tax=Actinophytocola sp. TaxID=1872138 RepID=UPI002ED59AF8
MSEARRTVEALEAARASTKTATHAAGLHRHRGERGTLPQHIKDLDDLVAVMATIHGITADLATLAKTCADNVRDHYFHGHNPTGNPWPEPLKEAAADADRALSRLRSHLHRTPAPAGHDSLSVLHGFLRDIRRTENPQQQ